MDVYFDDILISGVNKKEHDKALFEVIKRAKMLNIKCNATKLQYCVYRVKFLRFVFICGGVQPYIERIQLIHELKEPRNKKELQSFLVIK